VSRSGWLGAIIAGLGSFAALTTLAQSSHASLVVWGDYRALAFESASRSSALIGFLPIAINMTSDLPLSFSSTRS
jgi:hypothetical protein